MFLTDIGIRQKKYRNCLNAIGTKYLDNFFVGIASCRWCNVN